MRRIELVIYIYHLKDLWKLPIVWKIWFWRHFIMQRLRKLGVILQSYLMIVYRFHIPNCWAKNNVFVDDLSYCRDRKNDVLLPMIPGCFVSIFNSDYFLWYNEKYCFYDISYCKVHNKVLLPLISNHHQSDHSHFS